METNESNNDLECIAEENNPSITNEETFNFDSDKIFFRKYTGYKLEGKDVNATLSITRKRGKLEFACRIRYSNDSPTLKLNRTEENFAKYRSIKFCPSDLSIYAEAHKIQIPNNDEYAELFKRKQILESKIQKIYKTPGLGIVTKSKLAKPLKNQIEDTFERMQSIYAEEALKLFGSEWIKDFDYRLKTFIETDGRPVTEGGNGKGPYLQNWIHMYSLPQTGKPLPNTTPGCYGSGSRRK